MGEYRKLWWTLIAILTVTFGILGLSGAEVYRKAPPIPAQVVTASGDVLMTRDDILEGQTGCTASWSHGSSLRRPKPMASPSMPSTWSRKPG